MQGKTELNRVSFIQGLHRRKGGGRRGVWGGGWGGRCMVGVYLRQARQRFHKVQELCESRGGRPGLSVLTSLLVSVDVKIY